MTPRDDRGRSCVFGNGRRCFPRHRRNALANVLRNEKAVRVGICEERKISGERPGILGGVFRLREGKFSRGNRQFFIGRRWHSVVARCRPAFFFEVSRPVRVRTGCVHFQVDPSVNGPRQNVNEDARQGNEFRFQSVAGGAVTSCRFFRNGKHAGFVLLKQIWKFEGEICFSRLPIDPDLTVTDERTPLKNQVNLFLFTSNPDWFDGWNLLGPRAADTSTPFRIYLHILFTVVF